MLKIVVVDDNLQFVSVLENFLQDKPDIQVVGTASDGWHGLELIEEHRPDVVLLDMIMPRLDGLGVLDRLQALRVRPKVIMLTAYFNENMMQRAMLKGASDYLIKPFELEGIYERIKDAVAVKTAMYPDTVYEAGGMASPIAFSEATAVYQPSRVLPVRRSGTCKRLSVSEGCNSDESGRSAVIHFYDKGSISENCRKVYYNGKPCRTGNSSRY